MDNPGFVSEFLAAIWGAFVSPALRIWPAYLVTTLLICAVIYHRRKVGQPFWQWLLPKAIWLHASHIVDVKLFVLGRVIAVSGVASLFFLHLATTLVVAGALRGEWSLALEVPTWAAAVLILIVSDFGAYWVHRVHHENRVLWPFHSVHHSAEVMSPITVYRKHPIYDLIADGVGGVFTGALQGVFIGLFLAPIDPLTVAGVNAGYLLFNTLGANIRHSHVWLGYGRVLEHVFISPAQHQVHHSCDPRHFDKNYGEVLAVWDWMFGTLYVCERQEDLVFGLADGKGRLLPQRHDSLASALWVPMQDSGKALRRAVFGKKPKEGGAQPAPSAK